MSNLSSKQKSTLLKILKYWRNHHVSASDLETQEEIVQLINTICGESKHA